MQFIADMKLYALANLIMPQNNSAEALKLLGSDFI